MARGSWARIGAILGVAALVPACGGGGGGGGVAGTVDPGVIEFVSAVFSGAEGDGHITVTVNRSASSGPASVTYSTSDGTALAGLDYTAATGTLSWAAGVGGDQSFDVLIEDADGFIEGTETFNVSLSLATGASLGAATTAVVSILDADAPADGVFQFSAATYTVVEGEATVQATITVVRSAGSLGLATVDVAVAPGAGNPASTPADYVVTAPLTSPVTLTWNDGESGPKSFTIDIAADAAVEPVEEIALTLQNPTPTPDGPEIGTIGTAVLRIVDIDAAGTVELSASDYTVFENAGSVIVTVTRSGGAAAATVDLEIAAGTATAGSDYVAPATLPVPLSWAAGDITPRTVEIFITNDGILEGDETIDLALENETGAALGTPSSGTITILDDESGTLQFASSLVAVTEGNTGTTTDVTVTVTRSPGSAGAADVTVNISLPAGNGASYPDDFSGPDPAVAIPLHWDAGDLTPRDITFTIVGDDTFEQDEYIDLSLSAPSGAGLGVPSTASVKIVEDDLPPNGAVQFVSSTTTVNESAGSATLMVRRMGGTVGSLSFSYQTFNGTARGNGKMSRRDFTPKSETLTWNDGENADKPITITILDNDELDSQDAPSEYFRVRLNSVGGSLILAPTSGTVTILDD